ncbi:hypothetical protein DFA_08768 [Cavenderia fasciculata]|uniref:Amine oxidase domain-containing protein n=1 Tax=Cavenderia fasciculata TaxID=261658 RepID=F4Q467_CACFS|nr:uncharacterized protein DFA_08768 [Cavenderia fasciculata]EGG17769.1 hypothetical protein DFA_08768 [Cavenderia fasciculata]|eukprot:XP_004356253.1 hypothetical protein DFA_08768 [Cavenderia fasciculata]
MVKVAVVGGGISGMSAAYLLTQGGHEVTVFEKGDYLGGHTNTVDATFGDVTVKADTGFLVFNDEKYPNLVRLFKEMGIKSADSDVSFSLSLNARPFPYPQLSPDTDANGPQTKTSSSSSSSSNKLVRRPEIEWCSDTVSTVFSQWKNYFSPSFWMMIIDMGRFHKEAPMILHTPHLYADMTIEQFTRKHRYSQAFKNYYLVPVMSALWSTSFAEIDQFPILTLVRFFNNHSMFQMFGRPQWKTVLGGSYLYMAKLREYLEANNSRVLLSSPATQIIRHPETDSVDIVYTTAEGTTPATETFDYVVMACHPPDLLPLVQDLTENERDVMSKFVYTPHTVYLHSDERLMPKRKNTWSSWNYIYDDHSSTDKQVCVTYWINRIQPWLDREKTPLYVTLNPVFPPASNLVHKVIQYDHPLYNGTSEAARERLSTIQGTRRTYYCGAYYGYGFHEDGIISGLLAAQAIDPSLKNIWTVDTSRYADNPPPINKSISFALKTFRVLLPIVSIVGMAYLAYNQKSINSIITPIFKKIGILNKNLN